MRITDTAIKFKISVVVLTALICLGGVYSYVTLPKESNPSIEIPNIIVTTVYPGASPNDVENLITKPIEEEVQAINGIKEMRSTSTEGVSTLIIEFEPDVEISDATQKVRDKVDLAKPDLPGEAEEPVISEIDLSEFPILTINLAADYSLSRLKDVAEDLQDTLETIPSILEVDLVGGLEREVQVNVDLNKLRGYNLSFDDIVNTIRDENTNIPGGSVDVDHLNFLIRVDGQFELPREIEGLVVKSPDGRPIYIRDLASVKLGFKDRESFARLRVLRKEDDADRLVDVNQTEYAQVIALNVKKRAGTNILDTAAEVRRMLDEHPLPSGTQVLITGDQSKMVRILVNDLENNIISGLVFVVSILFFFLGVRTSILVGIAIPLSMGLSFVLFQAMGQTLNFVILFSLIIALGMLVDNAIVIVENIYRYLEEGHSHFEAARLGTGEVGVAVVASTATTVAAFVPMLFWPGIIGEFMSFLPMTLIVTLSASLFVALIINPVATGYLAVVEGKDDGLETSPWAKRLAILALVLAAAVLGAANPTMLAVVVVGTAALFALHFFVMKRIADRFVSHGLPAIVDFYRRFLDQMLEREYDVPYARLRNAFALGSFTLGFALLSVGGILAASLGLSSGLVLLAPGGLLFLIGILAILLHSAEVLMTGGNAAVKLGLGLAAVMAVLLGLLYLSPRHLTVETMAELMILPGVIIAFGLLGTVLVRGKKHLILTDNRVKLLTTVLGGLFAIVGMFFLAPTPVEFFPETDPTQIRVAIKGDLGTNVDASNKLATQFQSRIDELLAADPKTAENVKNALVMVGISNDPMGGPASTERSSITLNLVDYEDRNESSRITLEKIRDRLVGIPSAEVEIQRDQQGPPTGPPVNIEISGPDFATIVDLSSRAKELLVKASDAGLIEGLVDVRDNLDTGRPEIEVEIDRERAAQFGLTTALIASTVRTAVNGFEASKYRTGEDEYDITVRLSEASRENIESIRSLTIMKDDQQIPLSAVATLKVGSGLGSITRKDLERMVTVQANTAPGFNKQEVLEKVRVYLADFEKGVPVGYRIEYTGENKDQKESFSFLTTALIVGSSLIFMILIAQFNSVIGPFIIMAAVALSLIGVMLGLLLTRTPFGIMIFIGVISLAGIVVNNNIVLIDYAMQLRERGFEKRQAIVEAGATRLRPVLLTALTTVLGLIPLTFGINIDFVGLLTKVDPDFRIGSQNTQFWGPMGTAIISGLTFATFLTLVIVPTMYSLSDSVSEGLGKLLARRPRARDSEPVATSEATPEVPSAAKTIEPSAQEARS